MGRKKKYNRDKLIDKAMALFRLYGFAGTSTQMLVEELGVNRFSLYAEFANKQKLFEAAIERYNQKVIEKTFAPLELPSAGIKDIRSLIEFYASAINGPAAGRGCLLCNTAVEFGSQDPGNTGFVQLYFKRLSRAFNISLNNAYSNGELHNSVSPGKEADYFTATILGLFVMIRAKVLPSMIKNAAEMAIKHLEEL